MMDAESHATSRVRIRTVAKASKTGSPRGRRDPMCLCRRFVLIFVALRGTCPAPLARAVEGGQQIVLEEYDAPRGGDLVVVPVSVNGEPFRFILDTGCSSTAFVERHRRLFGKLTRRTRGNILGGSMELEYFAAPHLMLGQIELSRVEDAACINLDDLEDEYGQIDGILGMDALKYMIVQIDFDAGKVRFLKSSSDAPGRAVPIVWRRRKMLDGPFIAATIDGELPCEFLIDTGYVSATFGALDFEPFDILVECGAIEPLSGSYSSRAFSRSFRVSVGRLRTIEFEGFRHKNELFCREPARPSLGIAFLSRYVATFDFPNSVVYLRPGRRIAQLDRLDKSGIYLQRKDGQIVVDEVRPDSPGDLSGFKRGDTLLSIDQSSLSGWSFYRVHRLFSIPGNHAVVIRRAEKEIVLNLVSEDTEAAIVGARRER